MKIKDIRMGRWGLTLLAMALLSLAPATLRGQGEETIMVGHRNSDLISRIDAETDQLTGSGAGQGGLLDIHPWPDPFNPNRAFSFDFAGRLWSSDLAMTSFNPFPTHLDAAKVQGIFPVSDPTVKDHIATVGQFSSSTSASFLELRDPGNGAALDTFVSSTLDSNFTDVAFASDGTVWKYAIGDTREMNGISSILLFDVTQGLSTSNPNIDPGFDPNVGTPGPPYSSINTQMADADGISTQVVLATGHSIAATRGIQLEVFESPNTGKKYFIAAYSTWDCSPVPGIQYAMELKAFDINPAPGNPDTAGTLSCFSIPTPDYPTFMTMKVYGNFAFLTECWDTGGSGRAGALWAINLAHWESLGFPAYSSIPANSSPFVITNHTSVNHGLDGIGPNLVALHGNAGVGTGGKVYVGSTDEVFGEVFLLSVDVTRTVGTPDEFGDTNIPMLTLWEMDTIDPPSRPYPRVFLPVDMSGGNVFGPFANLPGNGSSKGGSGGGCTATQSPASIFPMLLGFLLLLVAGRFFIHEGSRS